MTSCFQIVDEILREIGWGLFFFFVMAMLDGWYHQVMYTRLILKSLSIIKGFSSLQGFLSRNFNEFSELFLIFLYSIKNSTVHIILIEVKRRREWN